jgi:predicted GIY-YIG superfamily endonuclease
MTASVYYLRDAKGDLLYIGCTSVSPFRRVAQHQAVKPWADEIRGMNFTCFETLSEAAQFEDREITRLQPKYNVSQRARVVRELPSMHGVSSAVANEIIDLWHGGGRRSQVVRQVGEIVGKPVNDAWCSRFIRKYVGTSQRAKPDHWNGISVDDK